MSSLRSRLWREKQDTGYWMFKVCSLKFIWFLDLGSFFYSRKYAKKLF